MFSQHLFRRTVLLMCSLLCSLDYAYARPARAVLIEIINALQPSLDSEVRYQKLQHILSDGATIKQWLTPGGLWQWLQEDGLDAYYPQIVESLRPDQLAMLNAINSTSMLYENIPEPLQSAIIDQNIVSFYATHGIGLIPAHQIDLNTLVNPKHRLMAEFDQMAKKFELKIHNTDFTALDIFAGVFQKDQGFDLSSLPPRLQLSFQHVVQQFISGLSFERKIMLIKGYLNTPAHSPFEETVARATIELGPIMIKLAQLFRDYTPTKLRKRLEQLLDQLPAAITTKAAKTLIEDFLPESYALIKIEESPLACASIGQVHKVYLSDRASGQVYSGIAKILKPDVTILLQSDLELIEKSLQHFPNGEGLYQRIATAMHREVNLFTEGLAATHGKEIYAQNPYIDVAAPLLFKEDNSKVLIEEIASGRPIHKWHSFDNPINLNAADLAIIKLAALGNLLQIWFKNAVFGDGFFHADLHAGNIFLDINTAYQPNLTLIDFGSVDTLSFNSRKAVIDLSLAVFLDNTAEVVQVIQSLALEAKDTATLPLEQQQSLNHFAADLPFLNLPIDLRTRLNKILQRAIDCGIDFPTPFIQLNRSRLLLENQIDEQINILRKLRDPRVHQVKSVIDSYMIQGTLSILQAGCNAANPFVKNSSPLSFTKVGQAYLTKLSEVGCSLFHINLNRAMSQSEAVAFNIMQWIKAIRKSRTNTL
ncbi:MAG: AarF/UbiB family protein [Zetaproteobacteria bacterium]|nr:AarF/UbiB family protein [Zetaproteobacteria bacterium]